MIERKIDFLGDWPLWQKICHAFYTENGYFALEEVPGWVMATHPEGIHSLQLHWDSGPNSLETWAVARFEDDKQLTLFLLKWA